jgi:hypothetical protein
MKGEGLENKRYFPPFYKGGSGGFIQPLENPSKSPFKKEGLKSPVPGTPSKIIIIQFAKHFLSLLKSHSGVKPENYVAMVKAIREFGRYPLQLN